VVILKNNLRYSLFKIYFLFSQADQQKDMHVDIEGQEVSVHLATPGQFRITRYFVPNRSEQYCFFQGFTRFYSF